MDVLLSQSEKKKMLDMMFNGGGLEMTATLATIDAKSATSNSKEDQDIIHREMQQQGFQRVNESIISQLNDWVAETGRVALELLQTEEGETAFN